MESWSFAFWTFNRNGRMKSEQYSDVWITQTMINRKNFFLQAAVAAPSSRDPLPHPAGNPGPPECCGCFFAHRGQKRMECFRWINLVWLKRHINAWILNSESFYSAAAPVRCWVSTGFWRWRSERHQVSPLLQQRLLESSGLLAGAGGARDEYTCTDFSCFLCFLKKKFQQHLNKVVTHVPPRTLDYFKLGKLI